MPDGNLLALSLLDISIDLYCNNNLLRTQDGKPGIMSDYFGVLA